MSLCCRASFGDMHACVCGVGRFKCHKLCCYFECIHSGDLHVILGKRAQSLNVYDRGTMARLIEPFVPFCQCMRACARICQSTPHPLLLPPTVKDYLDLLCRRAYVPSWLTCINSLCMMYLKTHAHAGTYTLTVAYISPGFAVSLYSIFCLFYFTYCSPVWLANR